MMDDYIDRQILIDAFMRKAAARRDELRQIEDDRDRDEHRVLKLTKEREARDRENLEQMVEATAAQVAAFETQLDRYDTATVQALLDNERALNAARTRREKIEAGAFRLPDGRIVFKTEDGRQVFDRHGAEVSHDTIDPDAIPDALPRLGAFTKALNAENKLAEERQDLHAFHRQIDEDREAASKGNASAAALGRMEERLKADMPEAVRKQTQEGFAGSASPEATQRQTLRTLPPLSGATPGVAGP